jgi:hypothetical protein
MAQFYRVQFQLPLSASPIFPDGKPLPQSKRHRSIKEYVPSLLRRSNKKESTKEMIHLDVLFNIYTHNPTSSLASIAVAPEVRSADAIVIWYDSSNPRTFHEAIYKVRL